MKSKVFTNLSKRTLFPFQPNLDPYTIGWNKFTTIPYPTFPCLPSYKVSKYKKEGHHSQWNSSDFHWIYTTLSRLNLTDNGLINSQNSLKPIQLFSIPSINIDLSINKDTLTHNDPMDIHRVTPPDLYRP